ncbi:hypothetical protein [Goodfellowiella coeruleoviolacea]|uniref:SpoVT-AbrB domain-containing protein n=1 Tax=Goodfellowiella coeruleoviolacea TaxID=334858 RepID=A0AAE3GI58_9PSEU|nr:hypothetical protein [Goodfellowiella coeruleoviolacea]MCP2167832.1 hypothetical protein [Goodfellowiella coeruleoviolacea]
MSVFSGDIVAPLLLPSRDRSLTPTPRPKTARALPLTELPALPRGHSLRHAVAALDTHGRCTDQTLIQSLGWAAGQGVDISAAHGVIVVRADDTGLHTLARRGHLRIPAPIRHWCDLAAGDRLLLAAVPDQQLLVIHTMAAVDVMLVNYYASLTGGDTSREHATS